MGEGLKPENLENLRLIFALYSKNLSLKMTIWQHSARCGTSLIHQKLIFKNKNRFFYLNKVVAENLRMVFALYSKNLSLKMMI